MAYIIALIAVAAICFFYKTKNKIIAVVFFFFILALHLFSIYSSHSWGDDFIVYLAQAKSLINGDINSVIAKQQMIERLSGVKSGPVLYPWGYPFFLAATQKVFGDNYFVYKILNVVAIILTGIITALIVNTNKRKTVSIIFLLIVLDPFLFDYKNEINADILFMLFTILSMLLIKNVTHKKFTFLQASLAGLTFFLCTFIKAAGVVVIVVFVIYLILHFSRNKEMRSLFNIYIIRNTGVLIAIYFAALLITNLMLPGFFADYVKYYSPDSIFKSVSTNLTAYVLSVKLFVYNANSILYTSGILISLILLIIGMAFNFRKYLYLNLFSVLLMTIFLITPYFGGARYLLPLLPICFLYVFLGAEYLHTRKQKFLPVTGVVAILLLIFSFCVNDFNYLSKQNKIDKSNEGAFSFKAREFYNFLESNTTTTDTIIFFKPRFLTFYLNRISASYYGTLPVSSSTFRYLTIYRDMNSNKQELKKILPDYQKRKVFDNGDFQVYNLKK